MAKPQNTNPVTPGPMKAGLDEILRKSCALMARRGFSGTSMRDLAAETGRSLAGLYHYFRSKQDLLYLINYHGFTTLNETWARMDADFGAPAEKLYGFIFFHTRYQDEGWPKYGYEAQVNNTYAPDPKKSGSLYFKGIIYMIAQTK